MKRLKNTTYLFCILPMMALMQQCTPANDGAQKIPYDQNATKEHVIPMATAFQLIAGFGKERDELAKQLKDPTYLDKNFSLPIAEKFNRDAIALLLNQKGAKGIRIYLGKDNQGLVKLVLIAVDDKGNDIKGHYKNIRAKSSLAVFADDNGGDGIALENGQRCPTLCGTDN